MAAADERLVGICRTAQRVLRLVMFRIFFPLDESKLSCNRAGTSTLGGDRIVRHSRNANEGGDPGLFFTPCLSRGSLFNRDRSNRRPLGGGCAAQLAPSSRRELVANILRYSLLKLPSDGLAFPNEFLAFPFCRLHKTGVSQGIRHCAGLGGDRAKRTSY